MNREKLKKVLCLLANQETYSAFTLNNLKPCVAHLILVKLLNLANVAIFIKHKQ